MTKLEKAGLVALAALLNFLAVGSMIVVGGDHVVLFVRTMAQFCWEFWPNLVLIVVIVTVLAVNTVRGTGVSTRHTMIGTAIVTSLSAIVIPAIFILLGMFKQQLL